ncbi:hypothetical protein ASD78_07090 [Lysobacter sp. Root667]|uniref:hypothetical protein n=1 Tax=Lysobacter sp. Root667 TaxID=1736581 RepID=UPI0006FA9305|nr:hypothetical protein [Lysobacter sp. Root667]KRA75726.1 hypothetical protein ASD78_07090 [Lysobacter sp. Root667]
MKSSTSTSTSCAVALAAGNAHAATYVVQAKALNFSAALANKITAAGDRVRARYRRIGAAIAAPIIGAAGGELQVSRVEDALRHGAADLGSPGIDEFFGKGRVNADDSLR